MSGCLENCQKYIPKSLFSPMQETRFLNAYCVFYCIVFYCVLLIDFILVLRRLFINCSGNFGYSSWNTIWIIGEILEFLPVVKLQDGQSHTKCWFFMLSGSESVNFLFYDLICHKDFYKLARSEKKLKTHSWLFFIS